MSAGAGGEHGESAREPSRALVIWLRSGTPEAPCRFERSNVPLAARRNRLADVVGGSAVRWDADATVRRATLDAGASVTHTVEAGRRGYVACIGPSFEVGGDELRDSDRVLVNGPHTVRITAHAPGDIVLIDVAT